MLHDRLDSSIVLCEIEANFKEDGENPTSINLEDIKIPSRKDGSMYFQSVLYVLIHKAILFCFCSRK